MDQQISAQSQDQTVFYMQERTLGQASSLDTFIFSPLLLIVEQSTRGRGIKSAVGPGLHSILLSGVWAAGANAIAAPRSADVPQGSSALHVIILQLQADLIGWIHGWSCIKPGTHIFNKNRALGSKLSPRPGTMPPKKHSTLNFKRLFSSPLTIKDTSLEGDLTVVLEVFFS